MKPKKKPFKQPKTARPKHAKSALKKGKYLNMDPGILRTVLITTYDIKQEIVFKIGEKQLDYILDRFFEIRNLDKKRQLLARERLIREIERGKFA